MTVEASGSSAPLTILVTPDVFRELALGLSDYCVSRAGQGGYATVGFSNTRDWLLGPDSPPQQWAAPPPVSASFFTVTLSAPTNRFYAPGNTDPEVPIALGEYMTRISRADNDMRLLPHIRDAILYWEIQSIGMRLGSGQPWWSPQNMVASNEMSYQCDAGLGSPATVDCAHMEWDQLTPASDTLTVGPKAGVTFLHSNTCYLAISSTIPLTLTWNQVRAAVSALMSICVHNPFQASHGGRAYYSHASHQIGKQERKRRSSEVTGLNALPPHVNITIFEQSEPWTNVAGELRTCAWQAVSKGHPVTSCNVKA